MVSTFAPLFGGIQLLMNAIYDCHSILTDSLPFTSHTPVLFNLPVADEYTAPDWSAMDLGTCPNGPFDVRLFFYPGVQQLISCSLATTTDCRY